MLTARVASFHPDDPLAGLELRDVTVTPPDGWARVRVRAASLNHHDLWSLRGVGLAADRLPMTLGTDAAGVDDDGRRVVAHAVIATDGWEGDETLDPRRTLLSEKHPGTLSEEVWVPRRNLVEIPDGMSFETADCLPSAYLTAYRMLFAQAGLRPGDTVLVQGSGGGLATAAIVLGVAAGLRVHATARDPERGERAAALGARVWPTGARLDAQVDAVIESVGAATWAHSLRAARPGGAIVVSGATSGASPDPELARVFFRQLRILGSTMGTVGELRSLVSFVAGAGVAPVVDSSIRLSDVAAGLGRLARGEAFGKILVSPVP